MHKATKMLKQSISNIDLAIEVVDARAPYSSENPTLQEIVQKKPTIRVLSKSHFADPNITHQWLKFYHGKALAIDLLQDKQSRRKIITLCQKALPDRGSILKPIRAIIFGIPNVGKSTLINTLAKRKIAKTGNEPAVTKAEQKIQIEKNFYISDTPGIMFPSPKEEASGFKLGAIGSIRDTAMDYVGTAFYLVDSLEKTYPGVIEKRYQVTPSPSVEALIEKIGRTIGKRQLHHISEKIVQDFRHGRMGRLSLEMPERCFHDASVHPS